MDREMMKALEADGEKLRAMTGEDHGPRFLMSAVYEQIAKAVCCGEHGRCILEDCDPEAGQDTACIALKGYHDKTISAVLAVAKLPDLPREDWEELDNAADWLGDALKAARDHKIGEAVSILSRHEASLEKLVGFVLKVGPSFKEVAP